MRREVFLSVTAEQQMHSTAEWYALQNPEIAEAWFNGLVAALESVCDNPEQFSFANEAERLGKSFRQMLYGVGQRITHRVLFSVREDRIVVHQIRHVAQDDVGE